MPPNRRQDFQSKAPGCWNVSRALHYLYEQKGNGLFYIPVKEIDHQFLYGILEEFSGAVAGMIQNIVLGLVFQSGFHHFVIETVAA